MRAWIGSAKVVGRQELAHPLIGLVVGSQRPEQRLLGLEVRWRKALGEPEQPVATVLGRKVGVHRPIIARIGPG
jgi:hypothetical protein